MPRRFLSETVGQPGVYLLLSKILELAEDQSLKTIHELREECSTAVGDLDGLFEAGLLLKNHEAVTMSTAGQKATLLLRALNDRDDLTETFNKLSSILPHIRQYQLIEGNITEYVVETLNARRDFIRLYICSPWIRLKDPHFSRLAAAVEAGRAVYPQLQIFVITLPLDRYNDRQAVGTVKNLCSLGATVMTHRKLHAKLYISEPGPLGGTQYAVFGSENLTGANQIELGVKVENDNEMLGRLTRFFFDTEQECKLLEDFQ